ncbi:sigma-54-dependent transcriptional regulator [Aestuariirhabdus sp. LZHN29]|uniref:sigma-54-dependent transcriptional regulator n=1 Tax=Aestuariirhabdus sp. LZHN29 TaxID=3417462 RepID=UPI003CF4D366
MSETEQIEFKGPVIFVDDEHHIRVTVQQTLELEDYSIRCFGSAAEVLDKLDVDWPGVIVSDINMPGIDGIELMRRIREIDTDLPVILVTGHGDISMAVTAIRDGAYDFIEKPFASELLVDVVKRALEKRNLTLENRNLRREIEAQNAPGPRILGNTPSIQSMRRIIHQVLGAPTDILLNGETGTGKELVARYLHEHSNRREKNFVAINCGAVPENLIESELFGHEAGAFTGADKSRVGKFEYANGGTLFLDEIESMPMAVQVKLLRVIEERMVERLGSNELIPLDIRIVAATKVDLKELSDEGQFRSDLFYRLNIVTIDIPALRDRLEDLPLLFEHFALIASARYQQEIIPLPGERMHQLLQHDWPGNVRELRNLAERYVLLGDEANLALAEQGMGDEIQSRRTLSERVDQFERSLIHESLQSHKGSIKETMVALGLARKTLYDKMKKHDLDRLDYK